MDDAHMVLEVTTHMIGRHCWPGAPPHLATLKEAHRHEFAITVRLRVAGLDREISFEDAEMDLRRAVRALWTECRGGVAWAPADPYIDFGTCSCEQIAEHLLQHLRAREVFPSLTSLSVFETADCGATLQTSPAERPTKPSRSKKRN